jgi:hypothetical protein
MLSGRGHSGWRSGESTAGLSKLTAIRTMEWNSFIFIKAWLSDDYAYLVLHGGLAGDSLTPCRNGCEIIETSKAGARALPPWHLDEKLPSKKPASGVAGRT